MQKVTTTLQQETTARRRELTNLAIPTSLIGQVDHIVATATDEFGMPKYASRNKFAEAAARALIFKERRRTTA